LGRARAAWVGLVLALGCDQRSMIGQALPLFRDCSAVSRALDRCDVRAPECQARVLDAVRCFADIDSLEPIPVELTTNLDAQPGSPLRLPLASTERDLLAALRAPVAVGLSTATPARDLGRASKRLATVRESPIRVLVEATDAATALDDPWASLGEAYALAIALRERPSDERWRRAHLDLDTGGLAATLGFAATIGWLTSLAARGGSMWDGGQPGSQLEEGHTKGLSDYGASLAAWLFKEYGDPQLHLLIDVPPTFTTLVGLSDPSRPTREFDERGEAVRRALAEVTSHLGGQQLAVEPALARLIAPTHRVVGPGIQARAVLITRHPRPPWVLWVTSEQDWLGQELDEYLVARGLEVSRPLGPASTRLFLAGPPDPSPEAALERRTILDGVEARLR
jgi:hypothetical protein